MENKEEGFYWVTVFEEPEVAKYTTSSGEWTIAGFSEAIEVHPSEIGPKIEPPDTKESKMMPHVTPCPFDENEVFGGRACTNICSYNENVHKYPCTPKCTYNGPLNPP